MSSPKYNINYFVKLNKVPCIKDQYRYTNIYEYFNKNINIKPMILVVQKIEWDDYDTYCSEFARELYMSLKKDLKGIDIDLRIYFTKSDEFHKQVLNYIDTHGISNDSTLSYLISFNDNCLIKNKNYHYYIFDK